MFDPIFVLSRLLISLTREVDAPHSFIATYDEGEAQFVVECATGGGRHLVDTRPAEWESVITLSLQGNVPVILPYIPDAPGFTLRGASFQTHRTIAVTPVRARGLPVYVMVLFFEGPISTVPEDLTLRLHKGSERMGAILEDLHRPRTLPMPAPEPVPVVNAPMRVKRYVRSRRPKIQGLGAAINRLTLARPSLGSGR